MTDSKRPFLGPVEKLLLVAAAAVFVLILFQKKTGKVVQTVETQTFTNGLSSRAAPPPPGVVSDPLPSIATVFAGKQHQDEPDFWASLSLSDDEKDFYKSLRNRYQPVGSGPSRSPMDWLSTLQAARLTYQKLAQVFGDQQPGGSTGEIIPAVLRDSIRAEKVFEHIEQLFKIPREDARSFAVEGHREMSDWALFVEKKQE